MFKSIKIRMTVLINVRALNTLSKKYPQLESVSLIRAAFKKVEDQHTIAEKIVSAAERLLESSNQLELAVAQSDI